MFLITQVKCLSGEKEAWQIIPPLGPSLNSSALVPLGLGSSQEKGSLQVISLVQCKLCS